mmetsp:Transcript_58695/g.136973  ORF Transcript_58695/g.136973 Transcript_58695/m.136973 type:complete len:162 (-) Transcript_58695:6-491(-)
MITLVALLIPLLSSVAATGALPQSKPRTASQENIRSLESGLLRIAAEAKSISNVEEEKHSLLMSQATMPLQQQLQQQKEDSVSFGQQAPTSGMTDEDLAVAGSSGSERAALLETEVVELRHELSEAKQVINRMQVQASLGRARAIAHSTRKRFLDMDSAEA